MLSWLSSGIALLMAVPFLLSYKASGIAMGSKRSFSSSSQLLSLFPGLFGQLLRRGFYRVALKNCSSRTTIDFGTFFPSADVSIGEHVYIGSNCIIAPCRIEDEVIIGSGVHIASKHAHQFDSLETVIRLQGGDWQPVRIGRDSWIGNKSIIMDDIGRQCIVGAGSVVVQPAEDRSVLAGNPAKAIRKRQGSSPSNQAGP